MKRVRPLFSALSTRALRAPLRRATVAGAIAVLTSTGLPVSTAIAQDDADIGAGRAKGLTCAGCHGAVGARNTYPGFRIPKIGGQSATYIAASLRAYRDGLREHPTMEAQAGTMSDEDIKNISAYIASLKN